MSVLESLFKEVETGKMSEKKFERIVESMELLHYLENRDQGEL